MSAICLHFLIELGTSGHHDTVERIACAHISDARHGSEPFRLQGVFPTVTHCSYGGAVVVPIMLNWTS